MDLMKLKNKKIRFAIEKSIKIKAKFIINDEKETLTSSSSRAMLNFGHTFGHALEVMNNYKKNFTHGDAISIGMILATKISQNMGNISQSQLDKIILHFKNTGLKTNSILIRNKNFIKLLLNDKKSQNNKIHLVLLKEIGKAYYARNFTLKDIKDLIFQTI